MAKGRSPEVEPATPRLAGPVFGLPVTRALPRSPAGAAPRTRDTAGGRQRWVWPGVLPRRL